MSTNYLSDELIKKSSLILESLDEKENDDMEEGVLGDFAKKVGKTVATGAKDIAVGLAKGAVEGVLGPKDVRLMKTASESFSEVLTNNGIKSSPDKISNFLSKVMAKQILKMRETQK